MTKNETLRQQYPLRIRLTKDVPDGYFEGHKKGTVFEYASIGMFKNDDGYRFFYDTTRKTKNFIEQFWFRSDDIEILA